MSFLILLICVIPAIFCRSFSHDELDTDLSFIKTCNRTSPISMRTMNEVLINKKLGHGESSAFKCFLHCLFMKYGWMDSDGGFLLHDIKQTLEESDVEIASLEFILYKCTATESNNRCERAFVFTQCFWDKMAEQQPSEDQFFYNIEDKK
ncbi:general odorant-binding protein 99b [Tribolium castaneum]|uniref:Odorant binding protein 11 n=1 Tax=Tribolium castaneum TaxID=7070 RepID=D2A5B1_TRICA|nr:PREDICTED: general odorant-binding protein 99b [Tribolium castaneum]EFA05695.1 odorant binding protein 11 [Tribolium castaneum]|eukprot:XP_008194655.1 PREDICTED: general odorant-binding protein 99b [Tribolium castaneum]